MSDGVSIIKTVNESPNRWHFVYFSLLLLLVFGYPFLSPSISRAYAHTERPTDWWVSAGISMTQQIDERRQQQCTHYTRHHSMTFYGLFLASRTRFIASLIEKRNRKKLDLLPDQSISLYKLKDDSLLVGTGAHEDEQTIVCSNLNYNLNQRNASDIYKREIRFRIEHRACCGQMHWVCGGISPCTCTYNVCIGRVSVRHTKQLNKFSSWRMRLTSAKSLRMDFDGVASLRRCANGPTQPDVYNLNHNNYDFLTPRASSVINTEKYGMKHCDFDVVRGFFVP